MNKSEFISYTKNSIRVLDGATGSFLLAAGMPRGSCTEEWVCANPEVVIDLQKKYIAAGSEIILAPTFGANRLRLETFSLTDKLDYFNKTAVMISKKAADGKAYVAGDISMTGEMMEPYGDLTFEDAVSVYKEQVLALEEAGCDLLTIETMISIDEVKAALEAANQVSKLPVMVTMTFGENGTTAYGTSAKEAALVITDCGADALGANCSFGPDTMLPVIETMAANTHLPVIAKPNAGAPIPIDGGGVRYDLDEKNFAELMMKLIGAGATLVGGCCGTTPAYIEKLCYLLERRK